MPTNLNKTASGVEQSASASTLASGKSTLAAVKDNYIPVAYNTRSARLKEIAREQEEERIVADLVQQRARQAASSLKELSILSELSSSPEASFESLVEESELMSQAQASDNEEILTEQPVQIIDKMPSSFPAPGSRDAPKFDESSPAELGRFISRMEDLFREHMQNATDQEKKVKLCKYASAATEVEWKAMTSFAENKSWTDFTEELISSYPEAARLERGSVRELDKLCRPFSGRSRLSPIELEEIMALRRKYIAIAKKLNSIFSNRDLVYKFLGCLEPGFARRVLDKLDTLRQVNNEAPTALGDDHTLEKVIEQTIRMAKLEANEAQMPVTSLDRRSPEPRSASRQLDPEPTKRMKHEDDITPKVEEQVAAIRDSLSLLLKRTEMQDKKAEAVERRVENLQSTLVNWKQSVSQPVTYPVDSSARAPMRPNPYQSTPYPVMRACFYCKNPNHFLGSCEHLTRHIGLGWVRRVGNRIEAADGSPIIASGETSMKDVVEKMNKPKGGILPAPKLQAVQRKVEDEDEYEVMAQLDGTAAAEKAIADQLTELSRIHGRDIVDRVFLASTAYEDHTGNFP